MKGLVTAQQANKFYQIDTFKNVINSNNLVKDSQEVYLNGFAKVCGDFITRVQDNIQNAQINVTGEINNLTIVTDGNKVMVKAPSHLIYQNFGVQGAVNKNYPDSPFSYKDKKPSPKIFESWIKAGKHLTRNEGAEFFNYDKEKHSKVKNEDEEIESIAYAIRESIFKNGFKPLNLYSKEIPKLIEDLENVTKTTASNIMTTVFKEFGQAAITFKI